MCRSGGCQSLTPCVSGEQAGVRRGRSWGLPSPNPPTGPRRHAMRLLRVLLSLSGAALEPKRSKELIFSALVTKQTSARLVLYTHRALIPLTYNFIIFYY